MDKPLAGTLKKEAMTKVKRKKEKTSRTYDDVALQKALKAIDGGMPVSTAAKLHNIPRTTLTAKNRGVFLPRIQNRGPECILGEEYENQLVQWMLRLNQSGSPVSRDELLDSVQLLLNRQKKKTVFKDNRPGRHWYDAFRARHGELAELMSQNTTHSRGSVTEEKLRAWFDKVRKHLESKQLLDVHPSRIFNCDEAALFLSPKGNDVLVKKDDKTIHNFTSSDEKECISTLFCGSADGNIAPPMVVFSYKRIPGAIAANMPKGWGIGHSENGWMTGETFYEYVANIFHPWLVKSAVIFPVILFLGGYSSRLTMALSDYCRNNKIELVALCPNATHILQPLDVAFLDPLKTAWAEVVLQWRLENNGERIRREIFAKLLQSAVESLDAENILKNGFGNTGLHPFSANNVDYGKYFKKSAESKAATEIAASYSDENEVFLDFFEGKLEEGLLQRFKDVGQETEWNGETRLQGLFEFWRQIKRSVGDGVKRPGTLSNRVINEIGVVDDNAYLSFGHHIFG